MQLLPLRVGCEGGQRGKVGRVVIQLQNRTLRTLWFLRAGPVGSQARSGCGDEGP